MSLSPINLFCLDLPFYKPSPGIPLCFLIHSAACNCKKPGHLLCEPLLAESKIHLSQAHMAWEDFLRKKNGATKLNETLCSRSQYRSETSWFLVDCCNISATISLRTVLLVGERKNSLRWSATLFLVLTFRDSEVKTPTTSWKIRCLPGSPLLKLGV